MEGGVVLPEGLFFSGLFKGAAPLRPGQVATRSAPGRLAPCPRHFVCSLKSQKSLKHDWTLRGRHAPGSCSLLPVCSLVICDLFYAP